jgi:hypothetical protein
VNQSDLLVKTAVALKQIVAEQKSQPTVQPTNNENTGSAHIPTTDIGAEHSNSGNGNTGENTTQQENPSNTRFFMSAKLDNTRVNRDVNNYVQEIIQHLTAVEGSEVELTLEVNVTVPDGIPPTTVRTVSENCRTLKVTDFGFDD